MRHVISASMIWVACALALPVAAQDKPVPMDQAPFHVPIFANDYITLLSINIPPGRDTGFHTHYADSVSVNLSAAIRTDQTYGSSEVSAPEVGEPVPGRVSFTSVTKNGQHTHRATNVGPTPFHNVSFILKEPRSTSNAVSDRSGVAGYTQIMDNEREDVPKCLLGRHGHCCNP